MIVPSLGAYEKHAQQEIHKHNIEGFKNNYTVYTETPVVIYSTFEHNANTIPWRETGAITERITMTEEGDLDYDLLQQKLNEYRNYNSLKVCSMSAGSNLTGIMFDMDRIAVMCHKAGFLVCCDYAAVSPYTDINFNGITNHL